MVSKFKEDRRSSYPLIYIHNMSDHESASEAVNHAGPYLPTVLPLAENHNLHHEDINMILIS